MLDEAGWQALLLSLQLSLTTAAVLALATPLPAWWLGRSTGWGARLASAMLVLPLVLPPTVLGFYLLLFLRPDTLLGGAWAWLFQHPFPFSYAGVLLASCLYSLPFAVQPCAVAASRMEERQLQAAAALGVAPWKRWLRIVLPQLRPGIASGATLAFAHSLGEFGVVLMVGGALPGTTKTLSIEIFERVETMDLRAALHLSLALVAIALTAVLASQWLLRRRREANS